MWRVVDGSRHSRCVGMSTAGGGQRGWCSRNRVHVARMHVAVTRTRGSGMKAGCGMWRRSETQQVEMR